MTTRSNSSLPIQQSTTIDQPRRFTWLLKLLIVGGMLGGGYFAYQRAMVYPQQVGQHQMQTVLVERSNLSITVSANGVVQPERSINVSPKTAGVLDRLLVQEGDSVRRGQILAYMDDSNLQGQQLEAQGRLAETEANLQQLLAGNRPEEIAQAEARLAQMIADLRQAEDEWSRNETLATAGAISRQTLIKATTNRDAAQAKVKEAQEALAMLQRGSRPEEIAQARAQILQAQGTLKTIEAQLNDTIIRAPFDGIVSRKYADPGAFVTPTTAGSSVLSATSSSILALSANNQILVYVPESNIAQIQPGQSVSIQADAYPGKTWTGTVAQIATQSIVQQNVTSFEVKVAIPPEVQQSLQAGMSVVVEFQIGQLKQALVVPTVAIARQENATGVYVATPNQQVVFTPVTTGATVNGKTEIRSGLSGKERVFISFPEGVTPDASISS
jgi:HlyD family secretion protein